MLLRHNERKVNIGKMFFLITLCLLKVFSTKYANIC